MTDEEVAALKEELKTGGELSSSKATKGPKRKTIKSSAGKAVKDSKSKVTPKVSSAVNPLKKPRRQANPRGVGVGRKRK